MKIEAVSFPDSLHPFNLCEGAIPNGTFERYLTAEMRRQAMNEQLVEEGKMPLPPIYIVEPFPAINPMANLIVNKTTCNCFWCK